MISNLFPRGRNGMNTCLVSFLVLSGAACADNAPSARDVVVKGLSFGPDHLTISVGTTVEWTNEDPVRHTVTSGEKGKQAAPGVSKGEPDRADGLFDHALEEGGSFSFTFEKPGTYAYFCRIHGGMTGELIVE